MRVVVTGREGQVVRSLVERGSRAGHEIVALGRPDLDLTADADAIEAAIDAEHPDVLVSAAAYTAVDKAESEPELAFAINEKGAGAVAGAARILGIPLVHLSTDYVFDGSKASPYAEQDEPSPAGVYGASKLAGEHAVLAQQPNSAILRTAWVYSPFAANFVKTMLRLAVDREEIAVVADQRGNPTSALDVADGVLAVAANLLGDNDPALRGIFHMTADGDASWAEFAEWIFEASGRSGGPTARVKRIASADYSAAARRPANSRLDCTKLRHKHGVSLPAWRASAESVVHRLVEN
ncbi:MAG: dTDP-4-dehydrorhamnose reductase [Sphingomonas sp.]|nr:dTDP-4-dehydrorhamnose reductase [Sphingomonas sp.]